MFYVHMWNEDSLSFKTKQAEKELVGQIYSTYNYIMLFQSQISSICECGLSVTWSMSNFWFAVSLSPPMHSPSSYWANQPLVVDICIRISIAKF